MVDHFPPASSAPDAPSLDTIFQALADPTRRAMLQALAGQPRPVGELAAPLEISLAGASKHIQVLEPAGLVQLQLPDRVHTCHPDPRPPHPRPQWTPPHHTVRIPTPQ